MSEERLSTEETIAEWKKSGATESSVELKAALSEVVRRRIGELWRRDGPLAAIDPDSLTAELAQAQGSDLDPTRKRTVHSILESITKAILVEVEPKEVTRLLWIWDRDDPSAQNVEQQLFSAIYEHLSERLRRIVGMQRFVGLRHKVEQEDLISELYMKLARSKIPRLPENRWRFYALADKAVLHILQDMQKAAARRPQLQQDELLDFHADGGPGQDQLEVLLDAEAAERELAKRIALEAALERLPPKQREAFQLRRNGVKIEDIAERLGVSRATVGRYIRQTIAFLAKALRDK